VVEVGGHLYAEAPKNRKYRCTVYPRRTPDGYPLAERLAARITPKESIGYVDLIWDLGSDRIS
jgi:hypothetical protein